MTYGTNKECICLECNAKFTHGKKLSTHLRTTHALSSEEYTIKHMHDGVRPTCATCGASTRYTAFSFKRFCGAHAHEAAVQGGKEGGKAPAWNKGLTKDTDARVAAQAKELEGDKNPFFGKRHSPKTIERISTTKRLSHDAVLARISASSDWLCKTSINDYKSRQHDYMVFECKKCKTEKRMTLQAFERGSFCLVCNSNTTSRAQIEIAKLISNLCSETVEQSVKNIISPHELDILIKEKNLAIEHLELWSHSDHNGYDRKKHSLKFDLCAEKDIKLLQFFSDEWRDKKQICESMIIHALGLSKKIGARECEIVDVQPADAKKFFNENHLSGHVGCSFSIGLKHDGVIVAAISFREPQQKKHREEKRIEIARSATATGISCPGWIDRLLHAVKKAGNLDEYSSIISYVDLRIGNGNSLQKIGFEKLNAKNENWWWTNGEQRFGRQTYKADPVLEKTEKEIAENAGVARIYGAGNATFVLEL